MLRASRALKASVEACIHNNAGIITLNRPKALNSLNSEMIGLIDDALMDWIPENKVKLVIQEGAGGKAFCAGGDVRAITDAGLEGNTQLGKDFFSYEYKVDYKLATLPVPLVSIIDGICMGGGVGISMHGPYRVATEKTMFAMPETGIGLFPDVGGGYFLPRMPHAEFGTFLGLTGQRLKGVDNLHAGVATHVCEKARLDDLKEALSKCACSETVEDVLLEFQEESMKANVDLNTRFSLEDHRETIAECFKFDTIDEITAALKSHSSPWANKQAAVLSRMSPTSLLITLEQIRQGKSKTLEEVLNMEHGIASHCMEAKDFYEGIRAVLVDRDNSPKWDDSEVDMAAYFKGSTWTADKW